MHKKKKHGGGQVKEEEDRTVLEKEHNFSQRVTCPRVTAMEEQMADWSQVSENTLLQGLQEVGWVFLRVKSQDYTSEKLSFFIRKMSRILAYQYYQHWPSQMFCHLNRNLQRIFLKQSWLQYIRFSLWDQSMYIEKKTKTDLQWCLAAAIKYWILVID